MHGDERAEREVRDLIEAEVRAIRTGDVDALVADLAPEVVIFDVLPPLRRVGAGDSRARTAEWLASYEGPVGYEIRDLQVTAGDNVAFGHFLYHVSGVLKAGGEVDMWVRMTMCLEKVAGRWLVTHEHTSVPFDATTGKASLELKP